MSSNRNIITPWGYFWLQILFNTPVIGFIFLVVFALGGTPNINKRNFARSYFCIYVVIIIVLAIMFALGGLDNIIEAINSKN